MWVIFLDCIAYLFNLAEGDHLFQNSGKFALLDRLLSFLRKDGHRVLLFCTSVLTLDVVQDLMAYRGYSYERLDGSVWWMG